MRAAWYIHAQAKVETAIDIILRILNTCSRITSIKIAGLINFVLSHLIEYLFVGDVLDDV